MTNAESDWTLTDNDHIIYRIGLVAIGAIFWQTSYELFRKIFSRHEAEFALRTLSTLHSIADIIFVILLYTRFDNEVAERYRYEKFFLANALGYVILDFLFCVHHDMESLIQLLNHIIIMSTFCTYLFRENLRLIIATGYVVLESTDPLLQLRWVLKKNNKPYVFVEYLFILAFIATRIGVFSYFGYHTMTSDVAQNIDKVFMVLNYIMGLIFVINILRYLVRKFKEQSENKTNKSKAALINR